MLLYIELAKTMTTKSTEKVLQFTALLYFYVNPATKIADQCKKSAAVTNCSFVVTAETQIDFSSAIERTKVFVFFF